MHGVCGCPEHVLSAKAAAASQWPRSCMDLTYFASTAGLRGMTTQQFDEQIALSLVNCTKVSGLDIRRVQSIGEADVEMRPEAMQSGILAYAYLPNNSCGDRLAVRFNSTVNWSPDLFVDTHTHELGHAFGLSHTNDVRDVMYPSMGRTYNGEFSDYYSIPQLTSRYGPEVDDDGGDGNGDDGGNDDMNIPWDKVIELVLVLVENCLNQENAVITRQLRDPRPLQRWRFERKVRLAMGIRPLEWRSQGDAIMQQIWAEHAIASDGDLEAMIKEARDRRDA